MMGRVSVEERGELVAWDRRAGYAGLMGQYAQPAVRATD